MNKRIFSFCLLPAVFFLFAGCATRASTSTSEPPTSTALPVFTPTPLSMAEVARQACQGVGNPDAAAWNDSPDAIHEVFVTGPSGDEHPWNQLLDDHLRATSIETLDTVICIGDKVPDIATPEECGQYADETGALAFPNLLRSRYFLNTRLVAAQTGQTLNEIQTTSDSLLCPEKLTTGDPHLINGVYYGSDVEFDSFLADVLPIIVPKSAPHKVAAEAASSVMAISPGGSLVASAYWGMQNLGIWDVANATIKFDLADQPEQVKMLTFSPDGNILAVAYKVEGGKVVLLNMQTGEPIQTLEGHAGRDGISEMVFSPDGKKLATGGFDARIVIWDVESGQKLQELVGSKKVISRLAFSKDGTRLLSTDTPEWETIIKTWDLETGTEILNVPAPHSRAEQQLIQYSSDGKQLIVLSYDSQADKPYILSLLDASNGNLIEETALETPADVPVFPSTFDIFLFNKKSLITQDEIWDFSQNKLVAQLRHGNEWSNSGVFLSPDGKSLLIGSGTGELYVMDLSWWLDQEK